MNTSQVANKTYAEEKINHSLSTDICINISHLVSLAYDPSCLLQI